MAALHQLFLRQNTNDNGDDGFDNDDNDGPGSFWWTRTGQIVRWSIFFGILFLFFLYMFIGHQHAKRRIRRGLPPLAYHRWLLNRRERALYDPNYQNPSVYYNSVPQGNPYYGMHPMPPPVYDHNAAPPPTYQPPTGATKIAPSQWSAQPTRRPADDEGEAAPSYEAPEGPPPNRVETNNTGASNNPFRG